MEEIVLTTIPAILDTIPDWPSLVSHMVTNSATSWDELLGPRGPLMSEYVERIGVSTSQLVNDTIRQPIFDPNTGLNRNLLERHFVEHFDIVRNGNQFAHSWTITGRGLNHHIYMTDHSLHVFISEYNKRINGFESRNHMNMSIQGRSRILSTLARLHEFQTNHSQFDEIRNMIPNVQNLNTKTQVYMYIANGHLNRF